MIVCWLVMNGCDGTYYCTIGTIPFISNGFWQTITCPRLFFCQNYILPNYPKGTQVLLCLKQVDWPHRFFVSIVRWMVMKLLSTSSTNLPGLIHHWKRPSSSPLGKRLAPWKTFFRGSPFFGRPMVVVLPGSWDVQQGLAFGDGIYYIKISMKAGSKTDIKHKHPIWPGMFTSISIKMSPIHGGRSWLYGCYGQ